MILTLTYTLGDAHEASQYNYSCRNEREALNFIKGFLSGSQFLKGSANSYPSIVGLEISK
jgi:hypothetical protein